MIVRQWDLDLTLEKVKAYQDDIIRLEDLTWSKYLNTLCNSRAKELIQKENILEVEFLFTLLSGYVTSLYCKTVLNDKESMEIAMSLATVSEYLQSKLRNDIRLSQIDWRSRQAAMNKIQRPIRLWISKSFTNFIRTSQRLF